MRQDDAVLRCRVSKHGFVARARNLVVWAEPDPDEARSHSLDTVVTGMGAIAGRVLPGEQAMILVAALLNATVQLCLGCRMARRRQEREAAHDAGGPF